MIRSPLLIRTAIKSSQRAATVAATTAASSIPRAGIQQQHALVRLTPTTRTFSTAHHHDVDDIDSPPPIKNTFGGSYNWEDPLCIKSSLTEEEV